MISDWKKQLFEFWKEEKNREYCIPIMEKLLRANFRKGKYIIEARGEKLEVLPEEIEEKLEKISDHLVKKALEEGYGAYIVPFIISIDQAKNFYIQKETPKEEELWWWLYHLFTALHFKDYIVTFTNTPSKIVFDFRNHLVENNFIIFQKEKSGINLDRMARELKVPPSPFYNSGSLFTFLILSYFAKFLRDYKEKEEISRLYGKSLPLLTDEATLLLSILSKEKKRVYVFPKLNALLSKYFKDVIERKSESSSTLTFICSFYIKEKKYKKKSIGLLDKFVYYLLRDHVNGELLSRLVELKASYETREGKTYGIFGSKEFFSKL
jgi:hypothetical protein